MAGMSRSDGLTSPCVDQFSDLDTVTLASLANIVVAGLKDRVELRVGDSRALMNEALARKPA